MQAFGQLISQQAGNQLQPKPPGLLNDLEHAVKRLDGVMTDVRGIGASLHGASPDKAAEAATPIAPTARTHVSALHELLSSIEGELRNIRERL